MTTARIPNPTIAFAVGLSTFVALFSWAYWVLSSTTDAFVPEPLSRIDAIYFTLTTLSTTGFGDLAAKSSSARLLVSIQMGLGLLVVVLGLARVAVGVRPQLIRTGAKPTGGEAPPYLVDSELTDQSAFPGFVPDDD